jgi:GNAT superfamily N-acetyltransferase
MHPDADVVFYPMNDLYQADDVAFSGQWEGIQLPNACGLKGDFSSRLLDLDDRQKIIEFRSSIFATLPDTYRLNPLAGAALLASEKDWADHHLGRYGLTLGIFHKNKIIAYSSLVFPDVDEPCFICKTLNLSNEDILRSAILAACMVLPEFRGLGLQRKLLTWREDVSRKLGRFCILAMTADVNNYSIKNMESIGLRVKWSGEIRSGNFWLILSKEI